MPCFVVAPDASQEKAAGLAALAGKLGLSVSMAADLEALRAQPAYAQSVGALVLLADVGPNGALADAAIRFAQAEHARAYIIYVSDQIAPEAYKRLLRTQAGEWSPWEGVARELADVVQRLSGVEPAGRAARIVGFLPSKGGVGNTMLALEAGVFLASQSKRGGRRIAILDLNAQGGTLADALDLEPRFDLRELTDRPERLDNQLIDVFVSRYSDRLDVFASPLRRMGASVQLDPQMIFAALDLIAARYDLILLDIPNQSLAWTDNLLLGCDAIVVAGASTVPALKQLVATLAYLDGLAIEPGTIAVAVNACETDLLGRVARRGDIAGALPNRRLFFVRRDVAVSDALNAGRPVMELSPGSRVAKDVRLLANWLDDAVDRSPASPGADDPKRGPPRS